MLELTPIPNLFANVITFNWPDATVQTVVFSGTAHEHREDAEASRETIRGIWDKNGRENVTVHTVEFAPIPF